METCEEPLPPMNLDLGNWPRGRQSPPVKIYGGGASCPDGKENRGPFAFLNAFLQKQGGMWGATQRVSAFLPATQLGRKTEDLSAQ